MKFSRRMVRKLQSTMKGPTLMTDRQTKTLLLAIALGLWANVATQWLAPKVLHAQDTSGVESYVALIYSHVSRIANGTCTNSKIC